MTDKPKFKLFANTTNPEGSDGAEQFLGYVEDINLPLPADKTVVIDSVPDHLFPHQRKAMEFLLNNSQAYLHRVLPTGLDVASAEALADKERGITLWSPKTIQSSRTEGITHLGSEIVVVGMRNNTGKALAILAAQAQSQLAVWDEAPFWPNRPSSGAWPAETEFRLSAKEVEDLRGLSVEEDNTPSFHVKDLTKLGYGKFPNASMRPGENIPATKPVGHDKVRARAKAAKAARKRNRRK